MKKLNKLKTCLFLTCTFILFSYAEVPYTVKDTSIYENFVELDRTINNKVNRTGDTLTGKLVLKNANLVFSTTTASSGIVFQDGTVQTSAGIGSMAISVSSTHFIGDGTVLNPLRLDTTLVTLLGPTLEDSEVPDTITLNNLTQIQNRSHTSLTDIGVKTHAQIDTALYELADTTSTFVPYNGAVEDVNLGLNDLYADGLHSNYANIDYVYSYNISQSTNYLQSEINELNTSTYNITNDIYDLWTSTGQLQASILQETTNRQNADNGLQSQINTLSYSTSSLESSKVPYSNATNDIDLNEKSISNINKIGVGVKTFTDGWGNNYNVGVDNPSEAIELYGNMLVRDGSILASNGSVTISSTNLSNTNSVIFDFSGDCAYNTSNWGTNNNLYGKVYGTNGCSLIIGTYRYDTPIGVPNGNYVTGIKTFIERYADNPSYVKTAWCRIKYNGQYLGYNKCENLFDWSTTTETFILGGENDTWGDSISDVMVNTYNTNGFGFEIKLEFTGNTTAYIDYMAFQAFSSDTPFNKLKRDNGEFNIYKSTNIMASFGKDNYALQVNGNINISSGNIYQNGVLFSGSGGSDNLGNHIATTTLNMNSNSIINASTISANYFYGDGSNLTNLPQDNLGNHIATMTIIANYGINASTITANLFSNTIAGTTNYIVVSTALYAMNGGSGGYTSFVIDDFTSQTNGSQTQFTLSQQPLPNSLQVSKNGLVLKSTDDYSLAGQVITMVTAPSSNTYLVAQYAVGISTTEKQLLVTTNTWTGTNTFNNTSIFNSSISINANSSQQYALTIDSNTNSSDGYLVSITTSGKVSIFSNYIDGFSTAVNYYADTDLIVNVVFTITDSYFCQYSISGYTDTNSTPSTLRAHDKFLFTPNYALQDFLGFKMFVKKNNYWRVDSAAYGTCIVDYTQISVIKFGN